MKRVLLLSRAHFCKTLCLTHLHRYQILYNIVVYYLERVGNCNVEMKLKREMKWDPMLK